MIIGVPKEIKTQEARVALLPSAAYQLIQRGHKVVVEK
ncbi:MAG: alanine dehydrogenase, partial [Verrucomicrobia bacterium]|nr:alanine dehydrogenase [Verrucomicrobiota bacterium]